MSLIPLTKDLDKKAFRDAYVQAIADLQQVQSANLNTIPKLEMAVKGIAEILEKTLKVLKSRI